MREQPLRRRLCNAQFCLIAVRTVGLVLFYYSLSIGLTFYQRWMLKWFHFPLSMVLCHLVIKFMLAASFRALRECCTHQERVVVDWGNYVKKIGPTGVTSGLDIAFSNWGLQFITISLYTMTKSTAIVFILAFALIFKLEKKSWGLIVIVTMIAAGLAMFTYKSTQFDLVGFTMVLAASFTSGLRWTLAQLVMQKAKLGLDNPVDMVYHVQPWMIIAVLPFAVAFEGVAMVGSSQVFCFSDWRVLSYTVVTVMSGALIAFLMEVAEYMLVSYTSSLTLSVAGIFKEICTLALAVEFNGDKMNVINFFGLLLCLGGITIHVVLKAIQGPAETRFENGNNFDDMPLLEKGSPRLIMELVSDDEQDENSDVLFSILQRDHR